VLGVELAGDWWRMVPVNSRGGGGVWRTKMLVISELRMAKLGVEGGC
jgi:hypothetical protein